jgi:hypothetical protein
VIPVEFEGSDYDPIADALEAFAEKNGGSFNEVSNSGVITLEFRNRNLTIVFDSGRQELRFSGIGISGPLRLTKLLAESTASTLVGNAPEMLGSPNPKRLN